MVGIDLSPDFVDAARTLTDRVGLTPLVEHQVSSGESLAFEDATFDRAMMIHVGMNIPDKAAVFAEVRRVLRPGGVFGLYEQMRTADGEPPVPAALVRGRALLLRGDAETYGELLRTAGFTVEKVENGWPRRPAGTARRSSVRRRCSGPASPSGSATTWPPPGPGCWRPW